MSETANTDNISEHEIPEVAEASGLARFFILRPVFAMLLTVLIIAAGLMAYDALIKESLPDLAIPQATISTFWPGADPQSIEQEVTKKIESELSSLKGLKKVTSASFDSYSLIAVDGVFGADHPGPVRVVDARGERADGAGGVMEYWSAFVIPHYS